MKKCVMTIIVLLLMQLGAISNAYQYERSDRMFCNGRAFESRSIEDAELKELVLKSIATCHNLADSKEKDYFNWLKSCQHLYGQRRLAETSSGHLRYIYNEKYNSCTNKLPAQSPSEKTKKLEKEMDTHKKKIQDYKDNKKRAEFIAMKTQVDEQNKANVERYMEALQRYNECKSSHPFKCFWSDYCGNEPQKPIKVQMQFHSTAEVYEYKRLMKEYE